PRLLRPRAERRNLRLLRPRRAQPLRPVGNSRRAPGRQFRPGPDDAGGQPAADSRRHQLRGGGRLPAGLSYGLADGGRQGPRGAGGDGADPRHRRRGLHRGAADRQACRRVGVRDVEKRREAAARARAWCRRPDQQSEHRLFERGLDDHQQARRRCCDRQRRRGHLAGEHPRAGAWRAIRQARPHDSTAVLNRRAPALLIGVLLVACGQPTAQPAPTASPRHTPTASPSPTPAPTPTPLPPPPNLPPAGGIHLVAGFSGYVYAQGLGPITAMVYGPDGRLYVLTAGGSIEVVPSPGARPVVLVSGLPVALGLAWRDIDRFVSVRGTIRG